MAQNIQLAELVAGVEDLAALPTAVSRLNELIDSDSASIDDMAGVIALEPSLAARLLKLVNSSFYGLPSQIDSIARALTLIGMNELRTLVLSTSSVDVFSRIAPRTIDLNDFWFRSVYVGLAARHLIGNRREAEQMFLMGLMLNVGRIVVFVRLPELAAAMLEEAESNGCKLEEIEKQRLGFTSVDVSAALLRSWQLAESLWKPLEYIRRPEAAGGYAHQAAVLRLALRLADCDEPELKSSKAGSLEQIKADTDLLAAAQVDAADLDRITMAVNMENVEVLGIVFPSSMSVF